jgi:hypothetical protein
MGIINSYTMESTFGGSTLGKRGKGKPGSGKQEKDFLTGLSTPNANVGHSTSLNCTL